MLINAVGDIVFYCMYCNIIGSYDILSHTVLYYCILLNHICQTHRTGLAVTLSITQSATPLFLALTAHVPLLLPLICQLTLQILTTWNCILFGVLPAMAGHTSTVFRCASSYGWSHLDGFFGVLPASSCS